MFVEDEFSILEMLLGNFGATHGPRVEQSVTENLRSKFTAMRSTATCLAGVLILAFICATVSGFVPDLPPTWQSTFALSSSSPSEFLTDGWLANDVQKKFSRVDMVLSRKLKYWSEIVENDSSFWFSPLNETSCSMQRPVTYQTPFWYVSQSNPDGYDKEHSCSRYVIDSSKVLPGSVGRLYSCFQDPKTPTYSRFEGYPPGSSQKTTVILKIFDFEPGPLPAITYQKPSHCMKVQAEMKAVDSENSMAKTLSFVLPRPTRGF